MPNRSCILELRTNQCFVYSFLCMPRCKSQIAPEKIQCRQIDMAVSLAKYCQFAVSPVNHSDSDRHVTGCQSNGQGLAFFHLVFVRFQMKRHIVNSFRLHTQPFYWAVQVSHRVFDIPIWISIIHLDGYMILPA